MSKVHSIQSPLLDIQNLTKYFPVKVPFGSIRGQNRQVKAVNDVSFQLYEGETLGIVGESGCGKSTTGRTILRLLEPTSGKVIYKNRNIFEAGSKEIRTIRQDLQMVFQDPYSSLNPRKRIGHLLEEPLIIHGLGDSKERTESVLDILEKVGLKAEHYYRYPHEFSGGQRQRIGLARALIVNPKVVICDEPVSALDVSIQSQIINLLRNFQESLKLTYLFISHDISVVRYLSNRIGVMYLGNLVEEAPTDTLFKSPLHPYTKALLSSVPLPNPKIKKERIILSGELPSPINPPTGCVFHTRCPYVMDICKKQVPIRRNIEDGHFVSCHLQN
ncbi:ABC transporter ATP-binding protein [Robertmurraya massiliosenegalensis]|uniref:ABC transporter ATP-binding protein n=1 Tax=Robertmurraya massiliosenegalensis TaxID=1287657 RepID=UPI000318D352|nr:dipeptide ABC transporter ATP-binding protein [Robertmurraya massiliosenegalensis]